MFAVPKRRSEEAQDSRGGSTQQQGEITLDWMGRRKVVRGQNSWAVCLGELGRTTWALSPFVELVSGFQAAKLHKTHGGMALLHEAAVTTGQPQDASEGEEGIPASFRWESTVHQPQDTWRLSRLHFDRSGAVWFAPLPNFQLAACQSGGQLALGQGPVTFGCVYLCLMTCREGTTGVGCEIDARLGGCGNQKKIKS